MVTGSPPPMRGKANSGFPVINRYRITPAYAGKSSAISGMIQFFKDHPRLCGEKSTIRHVSNKEIGSPPPMRGKAHVFVSQ